MRCKKGRLGSLLFMMVIVLPLVGLLIMDYQLKAANDITGAYAAGGPVAYASDNLLAGAIVLGVLVCIILVFTVGNIKKKKFVATMPLRRINDQIKDIDEKLHKDEKY